MYVAYRIKEKLNIDGRLDKKVWQLAPKSPRFVNIENGEPALYGTKAAVLWDYEYLYIGFWVEEPFVQAEIIERDEPIFQENNVEVFIDGGDTYYEFEINALNTIYEVFFIWKDVYKQGGKFDVPEFNVHKPGVHTFGGNHDRVDEHFWKGTHPRGNRWAYTNWDFPGLKTAVHVDGDINDKSKVDKGWTVELAFPWTGMKWLANNRSLPPKGGDQWNFQFARYEKLIGLNKNIGMAWDATYSDDNHKPEKFTSIKFSEVSIEKLD